MNPLDMRVVVTTTTAFAAIVYVLCAAFQPFFSDWAMYRPEMWAAAFPGFSWTIGGVLIGLVEVVLYAAGGSALYVAIYNRVAGTAGRPAAR